MARMAGPEFSDREKYEEWVNGPEFRALYENMTDAEFVDALFNNAGSPTLQAARVCLPDYKQVPSREVQCCER
jgi:hypothetical protein